MAIDRNRFQEIVDHWIRGALHETAAERALRTSRDPDETQQAVNALERVLSDYVDALQRDDVAVVRHQVAELIVRNGLQLTELEHRALAHEVLQGMVELVQAQIERLSGLAREDLTGQPTATRSAGSPSRASSRASPAGSARSRPSRRKGAR